MKMKRTVRFLSSLKIQRISVYKTQLPLYEGSYKWSGGKSVDVFDATVVYVQTNDPDIYGVGENTPLGSFYLPAYAEGTRAGIALLAPHLLGKDPANLNGINRLMDAALKGHPYVKSAIDMACWDIVGKVAGLPVCDLLGGRLGDESGFPLYRAISQEAPEGMASKVQKYIDEGYRKFQLKVGGTPKDDIERIIAVRETLDNFSKSRNLPSLPLMCDANTGWLRHQAIQVINAVKHLDVFIEQPCLSYEECLSVRRICPLPFIIDESMDDIGMLVRILNDNAADAINLKISKVGGLSKARVIRDLAVASGIPMNIEDTWGGDIVTAAISHLAHSTPPEYLLCSTDFNSYGPARIADTTAHRKGGLLCAPKVPGLGVEPLFDVLGDPVIDFKL